MKLRILSGLFVVLFACTAFVAHAQEMEGDTETAVESETTMETDAEEAATTTTDMSGETSEGAVTEEDIKEIIEELEELPNSVIEDITDLEGEIILITEDVVVLKHSDGSIIKVDAETYEENRRSAHRRKPAVGDVVVSAMVNSGTSPTITTANGVSYPVKSETTVTKNGQVTTLDDIDEGDEVIAVIDEEGNLVALEIVSEGDATKTNPLLWVLLVIVVLGALSYLIFRKK